MNFSKNLLKHRFYFVKSTNSHKEAATRVSLPTSLENKMSSQIDKDSGKKFGDDEERRREEMRHRERTDATREEEQ